MNEEDFTNKYIKTRLFDEGYPPCVEISLYDAQQWLMNNKGMFVTPYIRQLNWHWEILECNGNHKGWLMEDSITYTLHKDENYKCNYNSYQEALSYGLTFALEIIGRKTKIGIQTKLEDIIISCYNDELNYINKNQQMTELGLDELDCAELVTDIERYFNIELDMDAIQTHSTFNEIVNIIFNKTNNK